MSDDQKTALELEREKFEAEAKTYNEGLSGVGLRQLVGATRGRSTQNIKYLAFDESKPDTLPKSFKQFQEIVMAVDKEYGSEASLLDFMITGANEKFYKDASDPIAEYVNKAWKDEVKTKFRAIVRGLVSTLPDMTIEKASGMVRPGMDTLKDNFAS